MAAPEAPSGFLRQLPDGGEQVGPDCPLLDLDGRLSRCDGANVAGRTLMSSARGGSSHPYSKSTTGLIRR